MSEIMLPEPAIRWADDGHDGLREMCDFGARAFAQGECDLLHLKAMPDELDFIREYMAERHPDTPFRLEWPGRKAGTRNGSVG